MAKQTKAKTVAAILEASAAYRQLEAAKARKAELGVERRELEAKAREIEGRDLDGEHVVVRSGVRYIQRGPSLKPLEAWRSEQEREAAAVAVLDGENPGQSARERALEELSAIHERIQALEDAEPVADRRISSAMLQLRQDERAALQTAYSARAQKLVPILEALGEAALELMEFSDDLDRQGLDRNWIQGVPVGSYDPRREDSRLNLLIQQIQNLPGD